ncbi:MAG: biotin--[acetyl-CoA-carboxylase] ligase [Desulfobacterales bacterium]
MKSAILRVLRSNEGPVSGPVLCERLGATRVAVWKHIRRLIELGYEIEAGPRGYRLVASPDRPYPWEFPGREERIVYLEEVGSSMDVARELARQGCPAFTAVVAERQTAGRGRLRRPWVSEEGGLYVTIVMRPRIPVLFSPRVNFLVSCTLVTLLRRDFGVDAGVKWPNDILVGGRKLCGLLSEMEAEGEEVAFVNVGVGLNVNNDPPRVRPPAVSLAQLLGRKISRREVLARLLDDLEKEASAAPWEGIIARWKGHTVTLGKPVRVSTGTEEVRGVARDIDPFGALLVEEPGGRLRTVLHGDCFL